MSDSNGSRAVATADKLDPLLNTHTTPAETPDEQRTLISHDDDHRRWPSVSEREVQQALFKPKDTSPGEDKIPNSAWKHAWPFLKTTIKRLFHACLNNGYHPNIFKNAKMIAIAKPNRVKTSPRSCPLISLLPTLGKAIERLIANRLACEAIARNIIPPR